MASNNIILIATASGDEQSYLEVVRSLARRGYDALIYEPDRIADGSREFSAHLDAHGQLTFTYDGHAFLPQEVYAAWYRRPNFYGVHKNLLRWLTIADTYKASQESVWHSVPADAWLNQPERIVAADIKLTQLATAAKVGFTIPETAMSNTWEKVESLTAKKLIVKMLRLGFVPDKDTAQEHVMYTTVLDRGALPKQAMPYPGVWQSFIEKKREWRVTVVGDKVFAVAVYTDHTAKDDWRKHQLTSAVQFKAEDFPEAEAEKCKTLLKHYGLRYGAFDFIEKPDGELIYLEVNPNGQFKWLEDELGLPISEAIADELVRIAQAR